jgi:hypothetical protein
MSTPNTVSTPRARSRAPGIASRLFNHLALLVAGTRLVPFYGALLDGPTDG